MLLAALVAVFFSCGGAVVRAQEQQQSVSPVPVWRPTGDAGLAEWNSADAASHYEWMHATANVASGYDWGNGATSGEVGGAPPLSPVFAPESVVVDFVPVPEERVPQEDAPAAAAPESGSTPAPQPDAASSAQEQERRPAGQLFKNVTKVGGGEGASVERIVEGGPDRSGQRVDDYRNVPDPNLPSPDVDVGGGGEDAASVANASYWLKP